MLVEEFVVKIILPEGSKVSKFEAPFPTKRLPDSLHYTYLDIQGLPVVTIEGVNDLTEKHIMDFQLEFQFSRYGLFFTLKDQISILFLFQILLYHRNTVVAAFMN